MSKCKRKDCVEEALPYPRYDGYCSEKCIDIDYMTRLETEKAELVAKVRELEDKLGNSEITRAMQLLTERDEARDNVLELRLALDRVMILQEATAAARDGWERMYNKLKEWEDKVREMEEEIKELRRMGKAMCYMPEGSTKFENAVNDFEDYYNALKEAGE